MKFENINKVKRICEEIERINKDIDFLKNSSSSYTVKVTIRGKDASGSWREPSFNFPTKLEESQFIITILDQLRTKVSNLLKELEAL